MFSRTRTMKSTADCSDNIEKLKSILYDAEAVVIGAGAGLSTSAGFTYSGSRFEKYFADFEREFGFSDMYSGGFYPYETPEEQWAFWSRYIYINRYMPPPKPVYSRLFELVKNKDYFALTTNVDHCFQRAGFDKERLFYTQGDFGLFQCSRPCHQKTYDNEAVIQEMITAQGYEIKPGGDLFLPESTVPKMTVPSELVPHCPVCGRPMSMNLRADNTFVEDAGWHKAAERYSSFIDSHRNSKVLFLELGVGGNTPGIIKYPFMQMTYANKQAVYASVNMYDNYVPSEIRKRSICINDDIGEILNRF